MAIWGADVWKVHKVSEDTGLKLKSTFVTLAFWRERRNVSTSVRLVCIVRPWHEHTHPLRNRKKSGVS